MRHAAKRGAIWSLVVGLLALAIALVAAIQCLPFRISSPTNPWPWYCTDPAYRLIGYLAFPVNLLTNDLSQAIRFAPLSLLTYTILGVLISSGVDKFRRSS